MKISSEGLALIQKWEGLRLTAYLCPSGKWTVGYGHTGPEVKKGYTITKEKAEDLLKNDVAWAERTVANNVKVALNQHQFDALVSLCFNIGPAAFGSSTLVKLLNQKQYAAIPAQLRRWVYGANKQVLPGLKNRREDEIRLWNTSTPMAPSPDAIHDLESSTPAKANPLLDALEVALIKALEIIRAMKAQA